MRDGVAVFERRRWAAGIDLALAPAFGVCLALLTMPVVWMPVLLGCLAAEVGGERALAVATGVSLAVCTVFSLVRAALTFRHRVVLDEAAQTVRVEGLCRFEPWWRPRLGAFEVPITGILHAEGVYGRYGGLVGVRVVTTRGIVMLPGHLRGVDSLRDALIAIARLTPDAPEVHTRAGMRRLAVAIAAVLWAAALAYVVFVFVPGTLG